MRRKIAIRSYCQRVLDALPIEPGVSVNFAIRETELLVEVGLALGDKEYHSRWSVSFDVIDQCYRMGNILPEMDRSLAAITAELGPEAPPWSARDAEGHAEGAVTPPL